MKLSELIGWLADTISVLGDRDVYVTVSDNSHGYAAFEIEGVMGGDEKELVLNVVARAQCVK